MLFPLFDLNPHRRIPWLTGLIIFANVGVMIWLQGMNEREHVLTIVQGGFVPQRLTQLEAGQPVTVKLEPLGPQNPNAAGKKLIVQLQANAGEVYRSLFTMMFLHGGWLHLAMNMWMLWVFGNNIEDKLGHVIYLCFYILGGLVATLVHWSVEPQSSTPVIGASGAVAAVLGGYALTFPQAKVRTLVFLVMVFIVDLPALLVLGVWFVVQMVQGLGVLGGFNNIPIAFWAHIGGFLAGAVLMPIFSLGASPPESDWQSETDKSFQFEEYQR